MMHPKIILPSLYLTSLVAASPFAYAEHRDSNQTDSTGLMLGVAYSYNSSLYQDGQSNESAIPFVEAFWGPLFFSQSELGSYIAGDNDFAMFLSVGLDETEDKDRGESRTLLDMEKLKDVYSASIGAEFWQDWGEVSLRVSSDISNQHKGQSAELVYRYPMTFNQHTLSPSLSANWLSKDITRYYYGVQQKEQTVDRPTYQPGAALNTELGISYHYAFNKKHALIFNTAWHRMSKEVSDSPIVEDSTVTSFLAAYIYSF